MQELGLIPVQEKKQREPRLKARRVKNIELPKRRSVRLFVPSFSSEVAFCALGDYIDPTSISVTRGEEDYNDDDVLEHHAKSIETRIDSDFESQDKFTAKRNSFYSGYLTDDNESHENKRRKKNVKRGVEERDVPSVDDITNEQLQNIANFVKYLILQILMLHGVKRIMMMMIKKHHAQSIDTRIDSDDESQDKFTTKRNSFYTGLSPDDNESHENKRRKRMSNEVLKNETFLL
ncbi:hypothetical protein J6590_102896 [Homalodisca vitripennis]|nr:hypothetical protein J6590_102896 [Homalodisca vitripennis]